MDDQTRDGGSGAGPHPDVPLKRDRKLLRSSKPLPPRTPPAPPAGSETGRPVEADAPTSDAATPDTPSWRAAWRRTPQPPSSSHQSELGEPPVAGVPSHEAELTPAEQLFAGQWTASLPSAAMPASTIPPEPLAIPHVVDPQHDDVDLSDDTDAAGSPAAHAPRSGRAFETPDARTPARRAEPEVAPVRPYVPPGGFSGPAHPRLGPLAPVPAVSHSGTRTLDIAAFAAAFIVPPLGLIAAVVAIARGKKVRGWASDLARAAVSISVAMTIVFAGVGGYVWVTETENAAQLAAVKAEQRAHDRVEAASAPFCDVLAANPTIYSTADPDYGWPALEAEGGYLAAISQYSAVWAQLAEVAPPGIAEETAAISARVAGVVNIANALGTSNRAGDLLGLHEKNDLATVESWYVEYCNPPEIPAE